jgi:uncharacterized protein
MKRLRPWKKGLVWLLAIALTLIIMLRWFENSQVFHPYRTLDHDRSELPRASEEVYFQAADGVKLNAWFFPGGTNSARKDLVILVCHGNAGNIGHRLELAEALLGTGVSVLLFDYRGYGRSQGRPSEAGTFLDAQAAYRWLREKGFAPDHILAFGESLGGGVAAELAVRERVGGLILQSTFTSIPNLGAELFPWLPVRLVGRIHYNTVSKLPRLSVPVLVMHSRNDELVSFRHAEQNFRAAKEPKLLWEIEGGHNDPLEVNRDKFVAGIEEFLKSLKR